MIAVLPNTPKPAPPATPLKPAASDAVVPLWKKLKFSGRPYLCKRSAQALRHSENANATPAVIRFRDGREEPGAAIFVGEHGPRAVITLEAAERLADQLDEILAAAEEASDAKR